MKAFIIFSAIFSLCLSLRGLDYKRVYAEETHILEIGQVARYQSNNFNMLKNTWEEKLSQSFPIHLVGEYTIEKLKQPEVIYFIRLNPTSPTTFTLELGCNIITHTSEFKPEGIESHPTELHRLDEYLQDFDTDHYVVWKSLLGGRRIVYTYYEAINKSDTPKKFFKEFEGNGDGLREFILENIKIAKQCKNYQWSGGGLSDTPCINVHTSHAEGEDISKCKILENVLVLSDYIDSFKYDNSLMQPQIFLVESIKTLEQFAGKFYEKITISDYFEAIPQLDELAKKYTVKGYKQIDDKTGSFICKIYVYPNERGEHARKVKHDLVWINVESRDISLKAALENAFIEINNRLSL